MDLAEGILAKVDRAGMAAGVETRAPLLDMEVVRLAWRLPQHLKYHDGEHKLILKHLLARYLPEPLVYRPKRGFGPPMARWLAGPLRDWAEALLDPQLLRNQGCFDAARVRGIWEAFLRGERKWHAPVERADVPGVAPALARWSRALRFLCGVFCVACGGFVLRGAGRRPLRANVLRRRPLAVTSLYFVRKGLRPAFEIYRRFIEGGLIVALPTVSRASSGWAGAWAKEGGGDGQRPAPDIYPGPCPAGPFNSRRIETKARVRWVHSAWRRAEALAYECPPAPAVGRHLSLYFVRKGLRPAFEIYRRFIGDSLLDALAAASRTSSGRAGAWAK